MRIEYHRTLIADRVRLAAFHDALARVIAPGVTTVADIGTGTGILAMIAARLGAKRVLAYEMAEVGGLAAEMVRRNRLRNVEVIPGRSTEIIDPPRVDVVVSETLGNYAFEEQVIATLADARRRHLKPGGVLIPARIEQFVAPVVSARLRDELVAWDRVGHGLDLAPARVMSLNNAYVRSLRREELLDEGRSARRWDDVDFATTNTSTRKGRAEWRPATPAAVHGLVLWWMAHLGGGITLSTSPLGAPTHWEQLFLPALEPVEVCPGGTLAAELRSKTSEEGGTDIYWTIAASDARGCRIARQAMSLEKGFLP